MQKWLKQVCRKFYRRPKKAKLRKDGRLSFRHVYQYDVWASREFYENLASDDKDDISYSSAFLIFDAVLDLLFIHSKNTILIERAIAHAIEHAQQYLADPKSPPHWAARGMVEDPWNIAEVEATLVHAIFLRDGTLSPEAYRHAALKMFDASRDCRKQEEAEAKKRDPDPPVVESSELILQVARLALIAQDDDLFQESITAFPITEDYQEHHALLFEVAGRTWPIEDPELLRQFDVHFDHIRAPISLPDYKRPLGLAGMCPFEMAMIRDLCFISQDRTINKDRVVEALGF